MNLLTLNVSGPDQALLSIKQALPLALDKTWRKGDMRRSGALWEISGFSATVVDATNPAELKHGLDTFLAQCASRQINFSAPGIEAQLSIGVTVGDSQQFIVCIDFSPTVISALAACGVAVSFNAYPTSDEANLTEAI